MKEFNIVELEIIAGKIFEALTVDVKPADAVTITAYLLAMITFAAEGQDNPADQTIDSAASLAKVVRATLERRFKAKNKG